MNGFLTRLAERTLGLTPVAKAQPVSRFEQPPETEFASEEFVAAAETADSSIVQNALAGPSAVPMREHPSLPLMRPKPPIPVAVVAKPAAHIAPQRLQSASPVTQEVQTFDRVARKTVIARREELGTKHPATAKSLMVPKTENELQSSGSTVRRGNGDTSSHHNTPEHIAAPSPRLSKAETMQSAPPSPSHPPKVEHQQNAKTSPQMGKHLHSIPDVNIHPTPRLPTERLTSDRPVPEPPKRSNTIMQSEAPVEIVIGRLDVRVQASEAKRPAAAIAGLSHIPSLASCLSKRRV
jgi:hypothetical protein